MGKIEVEQIRCKGCGRCIVHCPKDLIEFSEDLNDRGYNYVVFTGDQEDCRGCTLCAVVCRRNNTSRCSSSVTAV